MPRVLPLLAVLTSGLGLSACTSAGGDYPSLAIRNAERVSGSGMRAESAEPALMPPASVLATETGQRIAQAVEQARKAHLSFAAGTGDATRAVAAARGAPAPADAWIAAQVALASLQGLRSQAVIALADLDLMFAQERLTEPDRITPTAQALGEARDRIGGWVDEQDRTITRLAGQLKL